VSPFFKGELGNVLLYSPLSKGVQGVVFKTLYVFFNDYNSEKEFEKKRLKKYDGSMIKSSA
jgi:hypothetical protein